MHEMSIAEGIVQILEAQAMLQHYQRVKTVWLEIGPLAMIEQASLRFCFDAVSRDSLAAGARLEIIDLPGEAQCMRCQQRVSITRRLDACSHCGSHQLQIIRGDEMRIKELEVE